MDYQFAYLFGCLGILLPIWLVLFFLAQRFTAGTIGY